MIENLADFILNVAAGAVALLCLFDGARRLGAHGIHKKALLLVLVAGTACALYGFFAYQRYADLKGIVAESQVKGGAPAKAAWTRVASPEKREMLSQAFARRNFRASGTLGPYVDRNGETKTFAPAQDDLIARDRVVANNLRTEFAARTSLAEALLWLIAGIVAVLLGFAMSFDNPPSRSAQSGTSGEAQQGS